MDALVPTKTRSSDLTLFQVSPVKLVQNRVVYIGKVIDRFKNSWATLEIH